MYKKNIISAIVVFSSILNIQLYSKEYGLDKKGPIIDLEVHKKFSFGLGMKVAEKNQDIKASFVGVLYRCSDDENNPSNLGRFVELEHDFGNYKFYTVYAMLGKTKIRMPFVFPGNVIGESGPSGPLTNISINDDFIFGVYTLERNDTFEKKYNIDPIFQHGVYWYDPKIVVPGL